mgnify:CR=1 FL=1|tara:strand:- start:55 stop:459 length:405 start_codon:yes stop_codon:yes gene_type:complete
MRAVEVYYNLHKKCLSVRDRKTGLVVKHTHAIRIVSKKGHYGRIDFSVSEKGRKKVLETRRKNVHATVRGYVHDLGKVKSLEERKARKPKTLRQVTYNPYKYESFVDVKTKEPVHYARDVFIDGQKVYIVKEDK